MRLIKLRPDQKDVPDLETARLHLRRPTMGDFEAWAALRQRSADFLKPFEPLWPADELSRHSYRERLRRQSADISSGRALPWFLFDRENDEMVGGLSVTNIRRGVAQAGTVGYWMGVEHAGQGLMAEALAACCTYCFRHAGLNRLEAGTVLRNERSQRLLRKTGFVEEGIARAYLCINGTWEDHILFAKLASDAP
ncbi:MAG: GNAT family protein [Pseudomonadota bacterium]